MKWLVLFSLFAFLGACAHQYQDRSVSSVEEFQKEENFQQRQMRESSVR